MNRHSRRGHAGFSMVELLVTIVIAGIAFAAMVPLFVQAQQKNSSDYFRVLGTNIVTDKLERVRTLDYDDIVGGPATPTSTPNLYNASFAARIVRPHRHDAGGWRLEERSRSTTRRHRGDALRQHDRRARLQAGHGHVTWPGKGLGGGRRVVLHTNISRQDSGPRSPTSR